jgi:glycosyltransferase involved in cell wall biosynthesis
VKILQIISNLGNGGAEKFVVELSNELSTDHSLTLCSFKKPENWMFRSKILNPRVKLISFNKGPGFSLLIYLKLYNLIKEIDPDIIHFHLDSTLKYILPMTSFFKKKKFVYTIHSDLNSEKKRIFSQLNISQYISRNIIFVCITKSILNSFEESYKNLQFKFVENGIVKLHHTSLLNAVRKEIEQLKPCPSSKVFLSVGRIDENKNQKLQLEAFNELKDKKNILVIVGSDPTLKNSILTPLKERNIPNVFFLGSKANISDYISNSDVLLVTSLNEGLPLVALEAMSMGKPIISTPAGGMIDLIENNKNGFISKGFSSNDLVEQMNKYFLLDNKSIEVISLNNLKKFEADYTINVCASKYIELYRT